MNKLATLLDFEAFADDDLGAAAADVDDEPALVDVGERVRHTQVDEPRFLLSRNDLDVMAEGLRRFGEHDSRLFDLAQRVGAHGADLLRGDITDALAEFFESGIAALERFFAQRLVVGQPARETHALAQPIDFVHFVAHRTRDLHVEAVRAEVDGGEGIVKFTFAHVVS